MPLRLLLLVALVCLAAVPGRAYSKPARAPGSPAGSAAAAAASAEPGTGSRGVPTARHLLQASTDGGPVAAVAGGAATDSSSRAAAGSAAPTSEAAGAQVSQCFNLHTRFGGACQVGIDRVASTVFSRGSTQEITPQQEEEAVEALRQGGLPSRG